MNVNRNLGWTMCAGLLVACTVDAAGQDARPASKSRLQRRVDELERRVEALERLLTSQVAPSASNVAQAEKKLEEARELLEFKTRLSRKGYVAPAEVRAAEFAVKVARKKLELARDPMDAASRILELVVLKAEHEHESAAGDLEQLRRLVQKGLVRSADVGAAERAVREAAARLKAAREALKQHREQRTRDRDDEPGEPKQSSRPSANRAAP